MCVSSTTQNIVICNIITVLLNGKLTNVDVIIWNSSSGTENTLLNEACVCSYRNVDIALRAKMCLHWSLWNRWASVLFGVVPSVFSVFISSDCLLFCVCGHSYFDLIMPILCRSYFDIFSARWRIIEGGNKPFPLLTDL